MSIISKPAPAHAVVPQQALDAALPPIINTHTSQDNSAAVSIERASDIVASLLDSLDPALRKVNASLHSNPETAYQEVFAHETLTSFLEQYGFAVQRQAWGLSTAFEATTGSGGRQVVFCAEYDALPDIGHGCGHNLIATSSLAAFVGAAQVLKDLNIPGRLRILGTPAEEGGGGKVKLIEAGAFDPPEDVSAAIMAHPSPSGPNRDGEVYDGLAGPRLIASYKTRVEFRGRASHAGAQPWKGLNALDAAVAAYVNVSMLRQQIQPDERVHGVFEVGGTVPNVIPEYTRMNWSIRSPTMSRCEVLVQRVKACFGSGAAAAGCDISYDITYVEEMAKLGLRIQQEERVPMEASTDMGNVSHYVPSFHGGFPVPTTPDVSLHNAKFTACAGTKEAYRSAIMCARGMAMMSIRVLVDDDIAKKARNDFEQDRQ
ncbi:hypothetical protein FDECE_11536 [Fusarium decemcellulare]|nr:hypothetical protein FDECE_11536 [Fusarium decemcellulare]